MRRAAVAIMFVAALALMGVSASYVYRPAGPFLVGVLLWIELLRYGALDRRQNK